MNHHDHEGMGGPVGRYPCKAAANEWHQFDNPNGQHPIGKRIRNGVATTFYGHTGSPYLRTNDLETDTEINRGQFIKIRSQFFTVARIERCSGVGCWCTGYWDSMTLDTNDTAVGRTTTSEPDISEYPVGPRTDSMRNHDMYEYDKDPQYWDNYYPPVCVGGSWTEGTKITLDQPIYRPAGTPNMNFSTDAVYVSSKKPCVDCKCAEGCPLTMVMTTDGKTWSGGGTNGQTWHGSAAKFTAKFQVPEVYKITFPDLDGYRDSSRMFVPATGNTRVRVHGNYFQEGPMLRCYFDTPRIMVKAEFIDEQTVECITPQWVARRQDLLATRTNDNKCADHDNDNTKFFAPDISDTTTSGRLYDSTCTDSKQNGATVFTVDGTYQDYAYSHIQVTNNGMVRDLSPVVHQRPDGAYSYVEGIGSDHRSTCYQLQYPSTVASDTWEGVNMEDSAVQPNHEKMEPCRIAHKSGNQEGNDVQIKFGTCYEAQSAKSGTGTDFYDSSKLTKYSYPNQTHSLGQLFQIPHTAAGPLVAVDLHLEKVKASTTNTNCHDPETCA
jgi:hypothetical protein